VADDTTEVLVVLKVESSVAALAQLRRHYRVLSVCPPRLAVVADDGTAAPGITRLSGVHAAFAGAVPESELAALTEMERLFVNAWLARQGADKKKRPGDKLPWDAPGFQPPDLPLDG